MKTMLLLAGMLLCATPALANSSSSVDVSVRIQNYSMLTLKPAQHHLRHHLDDNWREIAHKISGEMPSNKILWCDDGKCTMVYAF